MLLLLKVVETIPILYALHSLKLLLGHQSTIKDTESLLDHLGFLISHEGSFCHADVEYLLNLWHHQDLGIADGILGSLA